MPYKLISCEQALLTDFYKIIMIIFGFKLNHACIAFVNLCSYRNHTIFCRCKGLLLCTMINPQDMQTLNTNEKRQWCP